MTNDGRKTLSEYGVLKYKLRKWKGRNLSWSKEKNNQWSHWELNEDGEMTVNLAMWEKLLIVT